MLFLQSPEVDKIGRNGGRLFDAPLSLSNLQSPYIIPGLLTPGFRKL